MIDQEKFELDKHIADWLILNSFSFQQAMRIICFADEANISIAKAYIELEHGDVIKYGHSMKDDTRPQTIRTVPGNVTKVTVNSVYPSTSIDEPEEKVVTHTKEWLKYDDTKVIINSECLNFYPYTNVHEPEEK